MAADNELTTPALMVNGFGRALLMITQGAHHVARKGSVCFKIDVSPQTEGVPPDLVAAARIDLEIGLA
jgi:hypothetical protein